MGLTGCIFQGPGNFNDLSGSSFMTTPSGWDGISRPFVTTTPHDGMLFQDLL